ncbi:uncharacterized protein L969DRAFT_48968 [Mixia osmundae IAM 14324]|uniref:Uncharacterized protein n=1 Tax=Mixia osmundae (strain CBS 9802 / IAM 14324 / JCM 22182 / KY 12970) TaxID=764103 RepID=G7DVN8_MIXOS|nr:uncharacterized protein L969DRAFT_48968 [Mixia osmundae IAM 14324]KEI39670.1 hypothetical protein L969DRAFT_48968 [Mixia osmundae IAM 14324]GAA94648.1 hypothetical protein E5Q_01301 [Mixia osmundae IAM 14324]
MRFAQLVSALGFIATLITASPVSEAASPNTLEKRDADSHLVARYEADWALTFSSPGNAVYTIYFSLAYDPVEKSYHKLNYFLPDHGGVARYGTSSPGQSTWTFENGRLYGVTIALHYLGDGSLQTYSVISGGYNGKAFDHVDLSLDGVSIRRV